MHGPDQLALLLRSDPAKDGIQLCGLGDLLVGAQGAGVHILVRIWDLRPAGQLSHGDRGLADLLGEGEDGVVGIVGGVAAPDDLDQLHGHGGIEEVHADDLVLAGHSGGDLGDGDGGGVGGQDALRLGGGVQLLEDALLQVQALHSGLNHQIHIVQNALVLGGSHKAHAALQLVHILLGHLALGDHLGKALVQGGLRGGDDGVVDVHNDDALSRGGKDLGDAAAHLAGADDSNFLDRHSVFLL